MFSLENEKPSFPKHGVRKQMNMHTKYTTESIENIYEQEPTLRLNKMRINDNMAHEKCNRRSSMSNHTFDFSHLAVIVRDYLNSRFPGRWMD